MAKYATLRDMGGTEVGGFAVTPRDNFLLVEDLILPKQIVSPVSVEFDGVDIGELYDKMSDAGLHPAQYSRIWWHTHPGDSAKPSGTDESTFREDYGNQSHAVMLILSQTGEFYCRLKRNADNGLPGMTLELNVEVDWSAECPPVDAAARDAWREEYRQSVFEEVLHKWVPSAPGVHKNLTDSTASQRGPQSFTTKPSNDDVVYSYRTMLQLGLDAMLDMRSDAWRLAETHIGHTLFYYPKNGGDGSAWEFNVDGRITDSYTLLASQYEDVKRQVEQDAEEWWRDDTQIGFSS